MLLCRRQSRRVTRAHQDGRLGSAGPLQSYAFHRVSINPLTTSAEEQYGVKNFPSDTSKLAEMEFYLMDDLECDLTVFHPYRTLMTLCCREGASVVLGADAEAGELGAGVDDGPRYWGTGEGRLELHEGALQMAWYDFTYFLTSPCAYLPPGLSSTMRTAPNFASSIHHISSPSPR